MLLRTCALVWMTAGAITDSCRGAPGLGFRRTYRSPSKLAHDARRAEMHFCKAVPSVACETQQAKALVMPSFLQCLFKALETSGCAFGRYSRASITHLAGRLSGRCRDLLPLPLPMDFDAGSAVARLVAVLVVGLNFLHAGCVFPGAALPPAGCGTAAQQTALKLLAEKI
jgi:hypothetical protein